VLLVILTVFIFSNAFGKNAISYNKEGWDFLKKDETIKAILSFKNALKKNPRYKMALVGLGKSYLGIEVYDRSIELFNKALKLDKNSSDALVGLGMAFTRLGKYGAALKYFKESLKIKGENLDAKFGIALLYNSMDKTIWSKRQLRNILRISPFHYDSLLLMAEIKSSENRLDEAKNYIEKAIDANSQSPRAYIKNGEVLFRDYLFNDKVDSLREAKVSLNNALSIQPDSYHANRIMGNISLTEKEYDNAVGFFKNALIDKDNTLIQYCLAISNDLAEKKEDALKYFLNALKGTSSDSVLKGRFEDFLVMRDFKIGHPARLMLNKEYYNLGMKSMKRNLPGEVIMYLRRSLLLNPMDVAAREALMNYYSAFGYNRFYVDQVKALLKMNPGNKYKDRLSAAIYKRREELYHKEGFSSELPKRDVPRILVLNFNSRGRVTSHPDAGYVIASNLTFVLGQFGRMKQVGIRKRALVAKDLKSHGGSLEKTFKKINDMIKKGGLESIDYIVFGNYDESSDHIFLNCSVLDYNKGLVIGEFNLSEPGKWSLQKLCFRTAKRIFKLMPFKGRVLKLKDEGIVVNLGLFDGINRGSKFVINKYRNIPENNEKVREKIIFTVKKADTLISYAVPRKLSELNRIDSSDIVYPLKKRRAKKIK
ncbi:tetratricopeptide repeat protein, partial [Spirochaetota bacterium]